MEPYSYRHQNIRRDFLHWVHDPAETPPAHETVDANEVVTSLLVAGYETFDGHPILPSAALSNFAVDLEHYDTARYLKDSADAFEYFEKRDRRLHVQEFLRQAFAIAEDAHERGMEISWLTHAIRQELPKLARVAMRVEHGDTSAHNGAFSSNVWKTVLLERSGLVTDEEIGM